MPYSKKNRRFSRSRKQGHQKRNAIMQSLALERVIFLFKSADQQYTAHNETIAQNAVQTARKIAMGTKIQIPRDLKRNICHGCKQFLKIGMNARIRTHHRKGYGSWLVKTCLSCGHKTRYIIKGKTFKLSLIR